jgi:PKHD-type hydroxylase
MRQYWIFKKALSAELCDLAVKDMETLAQNPAEVGSASYAAVSPTVRRCTVAWAPFNHWIEGILLNHSLYANKITHWNFSMDNPRMEKVQLASYNKDDHFDWHVDWHPFEAEPDMRKISTSCLLNDQSEFTGGEFEFHYFGKKTVIKLQKGDVLVFPSFVEHRVMPITSGVRKTAVGWARSKRTL